MRALGLGLSVIVVTVAALVAIGLVLPSEYRVERAIAVDAPAEVVHDLVHDLERWPEWQPLHAQDPTIVPTLGRTTAGAGATVRFTGDGGHGELRVVSSLPADGIEYVMTVGDRSRRGAIRYDRGEDATVVVWTVTGDAGFDLVERYRAALLGKLVGSSFERALVNLKAVAEVAAAESARSSAGARAGRGRGSSPSARPPR